MKNRYLSKLLLVCIFALLQTSCSESNNSSIAKEEKIDTLIQFDNNQKVKEYFKSFDLVINEYALMIENLSESANKVDEKAEPSFMDAMDMLSDVTSSTLKMAPLLEKMEELEKEGEILKEEMTPEEVEAFTKSYANMMARFYELSKKMEKNNN